MRRRALRARNRLGRTLVPLWAQGLYYLFAWLRHDEPSGGRRLPSCPSATRRTRAVPPRRQLRGGSSLRTEAEAGGPPKCLCLRLVWCNTSVCHVRASPDPSRHSILRCIKGGGSILAIRILTFTCSESNLDVKMNAPPPTRSLAVLEFSARALASWSLVLLRRGRGGG